MEVSQVSWFHDKIYIPYQEVLTLAAQHSHAMRTNTNDRLYTMRLFKFSNAEKGPGEVVTSLTRVESATDTFFKSFVFFKLKQNDNDGRTHGVFLQFKQYISRSRSDSLISKVLQLMTYNHQVENLTSMNPCISSKESLMSYLQQVYGQKQNLLYNYIHVEDMLSTGFSTVNSGKMSKVLRDLRSQLRVVLDDMISIPKSYPQCLLNQLLCMQHEAFFEYMKFNTFDMIVHSVINDAYDIAAQQIQILTTQEQLLTDVMTRFSVSKSVQNDRVEKQIQYLIRDCFGEIFIHPSPFVKIAQQANIADHGVIDLLLFDYRFTMQLLLVSRWFARVCLQNPSDIQNNHANLVLYGSSGSGKSLILSALQKCIPTYTYLTSGHFQNPDILSSALIYFGEFQSHQLVQSLYKDLFDIKSSIKVDFKNIHPENVSQNVPIILSTNDDVISVLSGLPHKRTSHFHSNLVPVNENSVQAALRRLYLIPMRYGQYLTVHADVKQSSPYYQQLAKYNGRLKKEPYLLERIFNTIVAFAFFQNDIQTMAINMKIKGYVKQVIDSFINTYFGQFYYQHADNIRNIITSYEQHMFTMGTNDSELQLYNISACNKLGHIMRMWTQFNTTGYKLSSAADNQILTVEQLKSVSQPIMVYYLMENDQRFKESIRNPSIFFLLLNNNVFSYLHGTVGDLYNAEISDGDNNEIVEDQMADGQVLLVDRQQEESKVQEYVETAVSTKPTLSRTESKFMESIIGATELNKPAAYFPSIHDDDPFYDDEKSDDDNLLKDGHCTPKFGYETRSTLAYRKQMISMSKINGDMFNL